MICAAVFAAVRQHSISHICSNTWFLFTKKMPSYRYMDPHYKPKRVWRPSQVYNGNLYTNKTVSSQWKAALKYMRKSITCNHYRHLNISRSCMIWECTQHNNYNEKTSVGFSLTNDTPYLVRTNELWGVWRELNMLYKWQITTIYRQTTHCTKH